MHSKTEQEKLSKSLFKIRFKEKVRKTTCSEIEKPDWLLIISIYFLIFKFSQSKFANLCMSLKKLLFVLDNNVFKLF